MKSYKLILAAAVTAGSAAVCNAQVQELNTFIYSNTDPFIKSFSADLSAAAAQKNIKLNLYNANQDLLLQVDQMEEAAASNPAPMLVNPVDPNQGQKALEIAKSRHLPIIFFNRFPSFKDMSSYDQAWYVGADPYQAGALQADILQQWMQQHAWDRNSDGKLQLVILKGPENHPDTAGRTDALASSLFTQGIEVNVLAELNCDFDYSKAAAAMEKLSLDPGLSKIEAIVSNNDAMALGALNLLQSLGYNQDNANLYIPLIGVDAIEDAVTAVRQGTMLGTVRNDAKAQAQAVIDIASDPKRVSARDRIIQVPYSKVTQ